MSSKVKSEEGGILHPQHYIHHTECMLFHLLRQYQIDVIWLIAFRAVRYLMNANGIKHGYQDIARSLISGTVAIAPLSARQERSGVYIEG